MQAADQHRAEAAGTSRVGLVRGILVIVTAVAIGGFMVAQGLGNGADAIAAGQTLTVGDEAATGDGATTETASAATEGDPAVGSDTTPTSNEVDDGSSPSEGEEREAQEPQPSAAGVTETTGPAGPAEEQTIEVKILVLNGAGAKGIAGRGSEILSEAGYEVLAPKNADALGPSQVLYAEGAEAEARAVAEVFGTDPDAVVAPLDPATQPIGDIRDANIIVVVGQDGLIEV